MQHRTVPKCRLDDLLTIEELAVKLKIKPRTVRGWIEKRRIPFTKMGRRVYFSAGVVEGILQGNTVLSVSPRLTLREQGGVQATGGSEQ